ncbi:polymorphic outer membrane protein G family, partial [Chlamydia psittaci C6/98]
VKKSPSTLSI